jgi:DNA-directed RNA polymerase specialized sigma24 family protein
VDLSFDTFVRDHLPELRRTAYALTGDERATARLLERALDKVARWWMRASQDQEATDYAMSALFGVYLRRSRWARWRGRHGGSRRAGAAGRAAPLPAEQRAVLVATYLLGCSDDVIARLIGDRPLRVRSLRFRGSRTLALAGLPPEPLTDSTVEIQLPAPSRLTARRRALITEVTGAGR